MYKPSSLFTSAFISYSRRNLSFARKLYHRLETENWDTWFDQEDIPAAVDFQQEIEEGIRCTDNFIFIISPDSVASQYCRMEIEIAVRYHKRIIPLLHKDLETDKDWSSLHPAIGKINWLFFMEDGDFDKSYQLFVDILNSHKSYVHQHTQLLYHALEWQKSGRSEHKILTRNLRMSSQTWLKTTFSGQPPCTPTPLHCEFIAQSQKSAQNGGCEVFIGQLPTYNELREKVRLSLLRAGLTCWAHEYDIKPGSKYRKMVESGIELSNNILFFITEDSIKTESCLWEIDYARSLNKRIIPVVLQEVDMDSLPLFLRGLQKIPLYSLENINALFLNHTNEFSSLLNIVESDKEYLNTHKIILNQALKWKNNKEIPSLLLMNTTLELAKAWLSTAQNRPHYGATELHKEFINRSSTDTIGLQLEIYISYSRNDSEYARQINEELQLAGRITWFDQENISEENLLVESIENSLNLLFILSNQSHNSFFALNEAEYALSKQKRLLVLQIEPLENPIPSILKNCKIVDASNLKPKEALHRLLVELDSNKEYLTLFARWQQKANQWQQSNKNPDLLLRAAELEQAKQWYTEALEKGIQPKPTDAITLFLDESELRIMAEKEEENRRQREFMHLEMQKARSEKRFQRLVTFVVSIALFFSGLFAFMSYRAYHNSKTTFTTRYENLLTVMANVKAKQIEAIFTQMGNSLELVRNTPALVDLVKELEKEDATRFSAIERGFNKSLVPLQNAYNYLDIGIANRNGKILYKSNYNDKTLIKNSFLTEFKYAIDQFAQKQNLTHYITVGTKTFLLSAVRSENEVIGVFVAVFDLQENIYPLLNVDNTLGETGEIILTSYFDNQTSLKIISPAKFKKEPLPIPLIPYNIENAAHAQASKSNALPFTKMMKDYRGTETLTSGRYIPVVGWGIVVKIDKEAMLRDFKFF